MSSTLTPHSAADCNSPGSSIFDLPTTADSRLHLQSAAHIAGENTDDGFAGASASESGDDLEEDDVPSCLVISGGTGCNAICAAFGTSKASYVLPVSDDGGSSSEIIRVMGGPSIGDIRSRLIRLIPSSPPASPLSRIRNLLAYRLPANCSDKEARDEWRDIVEGRSALWVGIPGDRKEMIRGFLVHFESEVLKRAHKNFSFINGSIGNYFLSAAQEFFRSLPSAIFLFSSITNSQATILPAIVTNHTVTIAAELEDGSRLVGQCEISHPVRRDPVISVSSEGDSYDMLEYDDHGEDALSPIDGAGKNRNVFFEASSKEKAGEYERLRARINRLFYINTYGTEIHPSPNPEFIQHLGQKEVLVYSCGSLWTSIIPCLALRGVADSIARSKSLRAKILLLNSENDRETDGYTAVDYVNTIVRTLNTIRSKPYPGLSVRSGAGVGEAITTYPTSAFVTHLVYLKGCHVPVDVRRLTNMGVRCVEVGGANTPRNIAGGEPPKFDARSVREAIVDTLSTDSSGLNRTP
ncbi:hypothetical protein PsYK624_103500 [Phanerochaete sordida]|uniref:Uncharacterized protein n=1 Tax=Phanerochaete sordida TaxID=48140 RepID=A0A9P3LHI8_9APHY|nr:hypothetical protein PsYK624_103500 [Phanerochaete sordida]